ncbi:MAG: hypothetical protein NTX65_08495 [Ignavibacteriales bacterium]|nr:hypothetical protein [Ignavibacteriales bacterium]
MKNICLSIFFSLVVTLPVLAQTVGDTSKTTNKENKNEQNFIIRKIPDNTTNRFEFNNENIFIPLNLKIYQKAIINGYLEPHKFSHEELRTGMTDDELISFELNKKKTKRMLSELYGEDLIDEEKILESLGITQEQITWIVALLRLFLQHQ